MTFDLSILPQSPSGMDQVYDMCWIVKEVTKAIDFVSEMNERMHYLSCGGPQYNTM